MSPQALDLLHGDPLAFADAFWPGLGLYDKEQEVVLSVRDSIETYVTAGNKLGKDYTAAWVALAFFIAPQLFFEPEYVLEVERQRQPRFDPHTRRVVTTSVKDEHLDILWGEIGRHFKTCDLGLENLLVMTHHEIRFKGEAEAKNPINYLRGQVSKVGEGMAGHHAAYSLFVCDEASGVDDQAYIAAQGWFKRALIFGNPFDCNNHFRTGVEGGNVAASDAPVIIRTTTQEPL